MSKSWNSFLLFFYFFNCSLIYSSAIKEKISPELAQVMSVKELRQIILDYIPQDEWLPTTSVFPSKIVTMAISPSAEYIAILTDKHSLYILKWQNNGYKQMKTINNITYKTVILTNTNLFYINKHAERDIKLVDYNLANTEKDISIRAEDPYAIEMTPNMNQILILSQNSFGTRIQILMNEMNRGMYERQSLLPAEKQLAALSSGYIAYFYDADSLKILKLVPDNSSPQEQNFKLGGKGYNGRLTFSPDGEYLAIGLQKKLYIYKLIEGKFVVQDALTLDHNIQQLALSENGQYIFANIGAEISIWKAKSDLSYEEQFPIKSDSHINNMVISGNGSLLMVTNEAKPNVLQMYSRNPSFNWNC